MSATGIVPRYSGLHLYWGTNFLQMKGLMINRLYSFSGTTSIERRSAEKHSIWANLGSITTFDRFGTIKSTSDLESF